MSMISIVPNRPHPFENIPCAECSAPARLTGIEPHSTKPHTDLRTYQCLACDSVQAITVPIGG